MSCEKHFRIGTGYLRYPVPVFGLCLVLVLGFSLVLSPVSARAELPERVDAADTDQDGKPDEWKFYRGPLLVRMERDRDRNGKPEVWVYYEPYTIPPKEGEVVPQARVSSRPARSEVDRDGNGTPDMVRLMKEGKPERERADLNLDGKPDAWVYYSKEGVKDFMIMDKNHDGKPDAWFYYDQGGLKISGGRVDDDFDGKPDRAFGKMPETETREPWNDPGPA